MEERPSQMDPEARRAWLRRALEALEPGVPIEVVYPAEALAELTDLARDLPQVDWYPVELRDGDAVLEFVRRDADSRDRTAIIAFMRADHRKVHRLLGRLRELVAQEALDEARAALRGLSAALKRHLTMEEELLLPIIARRLVSPRGPAAVLRDEHLRLAWYLETIEAELATGAFADASRELATFEAFLGRHALMEDQVLYAITDGLLTEGERAAVVAECQRVELAPG